eukprot:3902865-Amphidinium_carterae.1
MTAICASWSIVGRHWPSRKLQHVADVSMFGNTRKGDFALQCRLGVAQCLHTLLPRIKRFRLHRL